MIKSQLWCSQTKYILNSRQGCVHSISIRSENYLGLFFFNINGTKMLIWFESDVFYWLQSPQYDIIALMATRKVCYSVNDLSSSININNSLDDKNNKTSVFYATPRSQIWNQSKVSSYIEGKLMCPDLDSGESDNTKQNVLTCSDLAIGSFWARR